MKVSLLVAAASALLSTIAGGVKPLRGSASLSSEVFEGYELKYTEVLDGHGPFVQHLNRAPLRNFASAVQRLPSNDTFADFTFDFSVNDNDIAYKESIDEPFEPSFDLGPAHAPRPSPRPHHPASFPNAAPSHAEFETHLDLQTDYTLPLLPNLRSSSVPQVTFDSSILQNRKRKHEFVDANQSQDAPAQRIIETTGDGNCFIYSTMIATLGNAMQHDRFRQDVVNHIERNVEHFRGHFTPRTGYSFSDHIETLRRDREWADNIFIQATANILNRQIDIHHEHIGGRVITVSPMMELVNPEMIRREPISVLYTGGIHYDALVSNETFEVSSK